MTIFLFVLFLQAGEFFAAEDIPTNLEFLTAEDRKQLRYVNKKHYHKLKVFKDPPNLLEFLNAEEIKQLRYVSEENCYNMFQNPHFFKGTPCMITRKKTKRLILVALKENVEREWRIWNLTHIHLPVGSASAGYGIIAIVCAAHGNPAAFPLSAAAANSGTLLCVGGFYRVFEGRSTSFGRRIESFLDSTSFGRRVQSTLASMTWIQSQSRALSQCCASVPSTLRSEYARVKSLLSSHSARVLSICT